MPTQGAHFIGTSGWSYAHWSKGRFYPPGLKQGDWLKFYATRYRSVEINLSFYRIPPIALIDRWTLIVDDGFVFALKLWRGITHLKRLSDAEEWLDNFFEVANRLGDKRGPLLVQLPPSFKPDVPRLDDFLARLPEHMGGVSWRVAVEFRHPDWLTPDVYAVLDRHGAAACLADMARCPITEPNAVDFVYVRRHGVSGHADGRYTDEQIAQDAERIRAWLAQGRDVYVYYNNDIGGHAVDNARTLMERLGA